MEKITNKQFIELSIYNIENTALIIRKLKYLIKNDKNEKNQLAYNEILNNYFEIYEKENHYHGSCYEGTGDYIVEENIPNVIEDKISKIYDIEKEKEYAEQAKKEAEEDQKVLKKDKTAKKIYDALEI